jgi:hypothetical protein
MIWDTASRLKKYPPRPAQVCSIIGAHGNIDATGRMVGCILDNRTKNRFVRNQNPPVVWGVQRCRDQVQRKNCFRLTGNLYKIAHFEWTEYEQHRARRKITECSLKSQANGQTSRTNHCGKTGGLNAKNTATSPAKKDLNTPVRQPSNKAGQRFVDIGFSHRAAYRATDETSNDPAYAQKCHYPNNANTEIHKRC